VYIPARSGLSLSVFVDIQDHLGNKRRNKRFFFRGS